MSQKRCQWCGMKETGTLQECPNGPEHKFVRPHYADVADHHANVDWFLGHRWRCGCKQCREARDAGYEPKSTMNVILGARHAPWEPEAT